MCFLRLQPLNRVELMPNHGAAVGHATLAENTAALVNLSDGSSAALATRSLGRSSHLLPPKA